MEASPVRLAPTKTIVSGVAQRPDTAVSCARAVTPNRSRAADERSIRRIDRQYTREEAGQVPVGPARPPGGCPPYPCLGLRRARENPEIQLRPVGGRIHFDFVAAGELPEQDLLREWILDVLLDRPLERTRPVGLVVPVLHQQLGRRRRELDRQLVLGQPLPH